MADDPIHYTEAYFARCQENVDACERVLGVRLPTPDVDWIHAEVLAEMTAERKLRQKQRFQRKEGGIPT